MVAYNFTGLDNVQSLSEAEDATEKGCITKEEEARIREAYPTGFYTPNVYVRVGLFILTVIIVMFAMGLLALFMLSASSNSFSILILIFGIVTYGALEFMVHEHKHFRSGVDDALLFMSVLLIGIGLGIMNNSVSPEWICGMVFCLTLAAAFRFADRWMATAAALSVWGMFFCLCHRWEISENVMGALLLMGVSLMLYVFSVRLLREERFRHYSSCLRWVEITALLAIYSSVNYFAAREGAHMLLNTDAGRPAGMLSGWISWVGTLLIPPIYLYAGIIRKNSSLLRVGMIVSAATILTVRYYHSLLPVAAAMTIGGILLIGIAYFLLNYLKQPKGGITSAPDATARTAGPLQLESLVIAQTLSSPAAPPPAGSSQFGGGSFGGGGAGGEY